MPTPAIAGFCCFHQLCQHRLLQAIAVSISCATPAIAVSICCCQHQLLLFPSALPAPAIAGYCCFHQLCHTGYCCFLPHWLLLFPSVVANTSYCCFHQLCQHRLLLAITASICCANTSYCCFLPHWLLLFPSAVPTPAIAVPTPAIAGYCCFHQLCHTDCCWV